MTKSDLLEKLKSEHDALDAVLTSIPSVEWSNLMINERWTLKDVIGHISAWHLEDLQRIKDLINGVKPSRFNLSIDALNEIEVQKRKQMTVEEIKNERHESFANLIKAIQSISKTQWELETKYKWYDGTNVTMQSVINSYGDNELGHEGQHLKEILGALKAH